MPRLNTELTKLYKEKNSYFNNTVTNAEETLNITIKKRNFIFQVYELSMENRNITINKIVSNYPKTTTTNNHSQNSFFTMKNTCGIAPRSTGLVSLIIQTVSLFLITTLITVLFFHVGGYNFLLYESKNSTDSSNLTNNTTYNILDKDTNVLNDFPMPGTLIQLEKNDISFEDFNSTQVRKNKFQHNKKITKFINFFLASSSYQNSLDVKKSLSLKKKISFF